MSIKEQKRGGSFLLHWMMLCLFMVAVVGLFSSCERVQKERDVAFVVEGDEHSLPERFQMIWQGFTVSINLRTRFYYGFSEKKKRFMYHGIIHDFIPKNGDDFSEKQKSDFIHALETYLKTKVCMTDNLPPDW